MNPNLLVGFETSDDAGVFRLSDDLAVVQTLDFFTPIVDDPYAYGQIAAANALSDVYAMGGRPLTVMNIACFDPSAAPPEFWAQILKGAYDKTEEAGAVVVGGHSVEDPNPKFGMSVTGVVNPNHVLSNDRAKPGDRIFLSKPLGTGIVTTAAKRDGCTQVELAAAVSSMSGLNKVASENALAAGAQCATDITGFGLAGHLWNVARASKVSIRLRANVLPLLPGVPEMISKGYVTRGATKNRDHVGPAFHLGQGVEEWLVAVAFDPQTSGGLAVCTDSDLEGSIEIGLVSTGEPEIWLE